MGVLLARRGLGIHYRGPAQFLNVAARMAAVELERANDIVEGFPLAVNPASPRALDA
jgi:hypothetical protein